MDAAVLGAIEPRGWGFLTLVFLVVLSNPSLVSELARSFRRLSRSKESKDIQYGGFKLFRLERIQRETGVMKWLRAISTICSIILIAGFSLVLIYLALTDSPERGIANSLLTLLAIVLFLFLPIVVIIDNHKSIRSSVTLWLSGDSETLVRFCLRLMLEARATITRFDAAAGQVEARLYDNEITIKVESREDSCNELTLTSTRRLINTLVHSVEYRRGINDLIRSLCYQENAG